MTEEIRFKRGDVVQLRSGGPAMTVDNAIYDPGSAHVPKGWEPSIVCLWMSETGECQKRHFAPGMLKMY